ncbi:efflux RND transporter permease subunit [Kushneria phosphatilytica]|uniref:Efflux pump membrane transporter n=1 Tax=Kushneria phosphatilytica TaxID=657387 RepID=A0A1S1NX05_9GAMM|nr:multidrug efflux RND transporter permease subunit [Kushneria phosphatilytica]OHV11998.1 RND transporter [Kushneria phosphatilytica]QEL11185.1 multidrug efflux RND transporter permease subunit [Kushneria phosphatilytica]
MNFASFFIHRPIFATVVSIIITLMGLMAVRVLPIQQYPSVVPPTVSVMATFPGADAETVSNTVASPLAEEINGTQDMIYLTSSSSDSGQLNMSVYFNIGTDPDMATINVNNRVQRALSQLPQQVQNQGVTVEKQSNSVLLFVGLYSPNHQYDSLYLNNYANLNIIDELNMLPGVGQSQVLGNQEFAMRVWLNPDKMAQYDITPAEISSAIQSQNTVVSAGKLGGAPQRDPTAYTYTISTQGRFTSVDQFRNIVLRTQQDGGSLRLSDVARVELGASSYAVRGRVNNNPMAPIAIYTQPGANALEVAKEVKSRMRELKQRFPAGIDYSIPYDTTLFINASIESVEHTFIEALILVAAIIFIFLQNWRSTLVAMSVVPVSVVGTFAGMYMLDFSINLLSLFGMILAIGIVVDDAIVVIENVERILEHDPEATPMSASLEAMREVSGPVIATALIMASVFVPVGFLSGLTGEMYRQFAITIAVSVSISALVALSFTPAMCAIFIKHKENLRESKFVRIVKKPFDWFNRGFARITRGFLKCVSFLIRHLLISLVGVIAVCVISVLVYSRLPGSLLPSTDQGVVLGIASLPAGSSVARTDEYLQKVSKQMMANPAVNYATAVSGYDFLSSGANPAKGVIFVSLKPWGKRDISADQMIAKLQQVGSQVDGGNIMAFNLPPILGLSTTGGFTGYLQSFGGDTPKELYQASVKVMQAASKRPELSQVFTTLDAGVPSYRATVDEQKAQSYGVSISDLNTTLSSTFGSAFVNYFQKNSRNFQVYLQSDDSFRRKPEDLSKVYVRGGDGERIPLSTFVTLHRTNAPTIVDRYNVYPAARFQGGAAPGYSSGQAIEAMQEVISKQLGSQYGMGWTGVAYQELGQGNAAMLAISFGIIMVFLILAAQYERWTLPLAVVTAVPFAFVGAIMAVWLRGMGTSVYLQIGLLTVVGLAAKNAILIVEFAQQQREHEGLSVTDAAMRAAEMRFRPIVMTSLAFIGGTLPLALAEGAGAANRHQIGTPVVGGMITITVLASLFVPATYVMIIQASEWLGRKLGRSPGKSSDNGVETHQNQH